MAILLPQSTAYTFRLGPFLDSTDGNTQENALTIAYTDVLLSKAGGALTAKAETTNLTGTGANAHYTCILGTGDTGTLGSLRVWCHVTGALCVYQDFLIVPALVYNSLVAGSDNLQVDTIQWLGTACATPTTGGVPEVDVTHVAGTVQTAGDLAALVTTVDTVVDVIAIDVAGLDGVAMRGTDNAALASVCTEARLAILSGALTESYAADGATATLTQLLYMLLSSLTQFSVSGTTITCKKLDGTTTSMTFTLDDGTNPTLRDRAT